MPGPTETFEEKSAFRVWLDDVTLAWVMELADLHHAAPASIIAAIVRDVAHDDRHEHELTPGDATLH